MHCLPSRLVISHHAFPLTRHAHARAAQHGVCYWDGCITKLKAGCDQPTDQPTHHVVACSDGRLVHTEQRDGQHPCYQRVNTSQHLRISQSASQATRVGPGKTMSRTWYAVNRANSTGHSACAERHGQSWRRGGFRSRAQVMRMRTEPS
jgi:hypothetical protein